MNVHAIRAIYRFEMARTFRTLMQSIASPVLSTSLYFVVFGAAIGSRVGAIDGISYGAFIIPGLVMLRSEEHTSELQSLMRISYAVFCLKNKKNLTIEHSELYDNKHEQNMRK